MTWTANINEISKRDNNSVQITVDYSDGTNIFTLTHIFDDSDAVIPFLTNAVSKLEKIDLFIQNPPGNSISSVQIISPSQQIQSPQLPVLSQKDIDETNFINDYSMLRSYQRAIQQDLIPADYPDYLILLDKVKNNFIPDYIQFI